MAKRIVLDPGHGGRDPGACRNSLMEAAVVLELAKRVEHYLRMLSKPEAGKPSACEVYLTRRNANALSEKKGADLNKRAYLARGHEADLFVSLHCNSSVSGSPRGASAIICRVGSYKRVSGVVGSEILDRLAAVGFPDRGVKTDQSAACGFRKLAVLRGTCWHMPGVLLECGFVSNKRDAAMLGNPDSREVIAIAIAEGALQGVGIESNTALLGKIYGK